MKILSCIFVIIGVIIGAGFASGKEIYTFFFVYGEKGIIGIIISSIIMGYIIYKSLKIIKEYDVNNYDTLLKKIISTKYKNVDIEKIINVIINIFLLITFFIMCAGFSAYFKQEFGIPEIYTSIIIAGVNYLILSKDTKGIFGINTLLIPVIIIILAVFVIKSLGNNLEKVETIVSTPMWFPKAILYASYNSITLLSVLIPLKKYIKNNKDILKISISIFFIIMLLAFTIFIILMNINIDISQIELPTVYVRAECLERYINIYME